MSTAHPSTAELDWLVDRVADRTGLDFSGSHRDRMVATVVGMAVKSRAAGYQAYADRLDRDPAALDALIDRLTVGETYFFREPAHFDLLRDTIVPAARRSADPPLRVWSAGCATGEEPYSVAIALDELGALPSADILGTDLSEKAIARARTGVYRRWSLRRCTEQQRRAWFTGSGDELTLDPRYREAVRWQPLNLVQDPPPGTFDVVLCRNVLIYLTTAGITAVTSTLHDALTPGGWLLLGASDPVLDHPGLHRVTGLHGIAYRRADGRPAPPRPGGVPARRAAAAPARSRTTILPPRRPPAPQTPPGRQPPDRPEPSDAEAVASIRALGARGALDDARRIAGAAIAADPMDAELRYVSATVDLQAGRPDEAADAAAAAIYLDPDLVVAHLLLGQARRQVGRDDLAERSLRTAVQLLAAMPADAEVPLAEGELAGPLLAVVTRGLLDSRPAGSR